MSPQIEKEIFHTYKSGDFRLGEFIYMGMGLANGQRVCISVAYKIDYCIKKALQFEHADLNIEFTHINKVRVGELDRSDKFIWDKQLELN